MSERFSARMREVSTPEELSELMADVRRFGSSRWRIDRVRARVQSDLWPHLNEHFDQDGRILPAAADANLTQPRSNAVIKDAGVGPATRSIVGLVFRLHADLAAARASVPSYVAERPLDSQSSGQPAALGTALGADQKQLEWDSEATPTELQLDWPSSDRFGFMGETSVSPLAAIKGMLRRQLLADAYDRTAADFLMGIIDSLARDQALCEVELEELERLWGDAIDNGFDPESVSTINSNDT